MEGTTVSVVLWEEDAQSGVIVELEEQRQKNFRSFEALRSAATVGEIRAADLAPWARSIVDSYLEDLAWDRQDDGDEVTTVSDDEPWDYGDVAELVMEAAPLPHDAMVAASWLGTDLLREHAAVGGASPGGEHRRLLSN
jgi:hypothetical protein